MLGVRVMEEKDMTHVISTDRLLHVLQSIALYEKTGQLKVEHVGTESDKGEVYFINGNTVFACTAYESGETALARLMGWQEILYTFYEGVQAPVRLNQYTLSPQQLKNTRPLLPIELEETRQTPAIGIPVLPRNARQAEVDPRSTPARIPAVKPPTLPITPLPEVAECAVKMGKLGVYAVFKALPQATSPTILQQMERKDRIVLLLLDGRRTLQNVAYLVHRSELDIARVLVRLLKQGYIEYIKA